MKTTEQTASVLEAKATLRQSVAERVRAVGARTRRGWDAAIADRVVRSEAFRNAGAVVGYFALSDEVNVDSILATAVEVGKRTFVPLVRGSTLRFARWRPCTVLQRSERGVLQRSEEGVAGHEIGTCLVLLPGRVFDAAGGRIGRGRGYYDRAFAEPLHGVCLAGIGYELQLVGPVPVASHDRRVETIYTEERRVVCR